MSNRVDYPGRTSCGCPYLNQPDPERHWKDCHYRLNAQQAEPAPAQDEREAFKRALHSQKVFKLSSATMSAAEWAWFARPAQAEQQPVGWQFYQDGKWWNGDDRIKDHRKNTEAVGIPVRDLYAAPHRADRA